MLQIRGNYKLYFLELFPDLDNPHLFRNRDEAFQKEHRQAPAFAGWTGYGRENTDCHLCCADRSDQCNSISSADEDRRKEAFRVLAVIP